MSPEHQHQWRQGTVSAINKPGRGNCCAFIGVDLNGAFESMSAFPFQPSSSAKMPLPPNHETIAVPNEFVNVVAQLYPGHSIRYKYESTVVENRVYTLEKVFRPSALSRVDQRRTRSRGSGKDQKRHIGRHHDADESQQGRRKRDRSSDYYNDSKIPKKSSRALKDRRRPQSRSQDSKHILSGLKGHESDYDDREEPRRGRGRVRELGYDFSNRNEFPNATENQREPGGRGRDRQLDRLSDDDSRRPNGYPDNWVGPQGPSRELNGSPGPSRGPRRPNIVPEYSGRLPGHVFPQIGTATGSRIPNREPYGAERPPVVHSRPSGHDIVGGQSRPGGHGESRYNSNMNGFGGPDAGRSGFEAPGGISGGRASQNRWNGGNLSDSDTGIGNRLGGRDRSAYGGDAGGMWGPPGRPNGGGFDANANGHGSLPGVQSRGYAHGVPGNRAAQGLWGGADLGGNTNGFGRPPAGRTPSFGGAIGTNRALSGQRSGDALGGNVNGIGGPRVERNAGRLNDSPNGPVAQWGQGRGGANYGNCQAQEQREHFGFEDIEGGMEPRNSGQRPPANVFQLVVRPGVIEAEGPQFRFSLPIR